MAPRARAALDASVLGIARGLPMMNVGIHAFITGSRRMRRISTQTAAAMVLVAGPAGLFLYWYTQPGVDPTVRAPGGHFYIVSLVALICFVLAVPATVAAARTAEVRLVALALSFLSVSGFFAVHGLATPGFLVDRPPRAEPPPATVRAGEPPAVAAVTVAASDAPYAEAVDEYGDAVGHAGHAPSTSVGGQAAPPARYANVVGLSARLSLLAGALFLAASAVEWGERVSRLVVSRVRALCVGWGLLMAVYAVVGLAFPEYVPPEVMQKQVFLDATLAIVVGCTLFAAWRYGTGYRYSGLSLHLAAAVAAVLMFEAQIGMHFGEVWRGSWWTYHFELMGGFGAMLSAVVAESRRGRGPVLALERMPLRDALSQIEQGYSPAIRALAASLEARDPYTHGHGRRVAALAYYIGREMGFSPPRLRAVVQGALLHDVGKIGVPDGILLKPGALTQDEFARIKEHPSAGEQLMLVTTGGAIERAVIRHHHEWFDGSGYPDGLRGEEIPLEARVVAVADVYDALRSNRAYRPAWSREATLELIESESGTHFDPRCVEALLRVADEFEVEFAPEASEQQSAPLEYGQAAA